MECKLPVRVSLISLCWLTLPCRPTTRAYGGFFRSASYLEKSCSAIHKRELFSRYSKMPEEVTLHRSLAFTYDSQYLRLLYNINSPPNTWSSKFKSKGGAALWKGQYRFLRPAYAVLVFSFLKTKNKGFLRSGWVLSCDPSQWIETITTPRTKVEFGLHLRMRATVAVISRKRNWCSSCQMELLDGALVTSK